MGIANQVRFRSFAVIMALASTASCSKTFSINLDYASIETPKTVAVGQAINSKVRLQYATSSYAIHFLGFRNKESGTHHYAISAPAEYTSHGERVVNAMYWWKDTTCTINTAGAGQYILDFSDSRGLYRSDTVIVQ